MQLKVQYRAICLIERLTLTFFFNSNSLSGQCPYTILIIESLKLLWVNPSMRNIMMTEIKVERTKTNHFVKHVSQELATCR